MVTLILIIIVISILILVHEWGHFYSARKLGVKVEEFGFGFPPRLGTIYIKDGKLRWIFGYKPVISKIVGPSFTLNWLPFGGFVKIFGEHGEGEDDPQSFMSRPAWHRFIILVAGVFMNFAAAWVFFSIGSAVGIPQISDEGSGGPISIIGVLPDSPAERAGLKFGDKIFELKSRDLSLRVESEKDVQNFMEAYRGEEVTIIIGRGNIVENLRATPRVNFPEGEGPLGIAIAHLTIVRAPWYLAPFEGLKTLYRSVVVTVGGLYFIVHDLVLGKGADVAVSGPVGIFFFADDVRSLGFAYFLQFIGMLSVNLAVLNFLPIPALDGGRIFFLAIEKIKGSRVSPVVENFAHTIGFVLLIFLMLIVTYRDIVRIF